MIAYHFMREGLRSGAGEEPAWTLGEERSIEGEIVLCQHGYHSSPTLLDALQYAPGPIACLVEISEPEAQDEAKYVSRTRKLLAFADVSKELRQFAIDCAERALIREREQGREPDERSWKAVEAARAFLHEEITSEEIEAAQAAAQAVAQPTDWEAARTAARVAAQEADLVAAWTTTQVVAKAAAWTVAREAAVAAAVHAADRADTRTEAWVAERDWQRQHLHNLIEPVISQALATAKR